MPATQIRFLANLKPTFKRRKLEGRPHLVVPTTILGEAVLEGAGAGGVPLLYTNEENEKSAPAWNHIPVVIDHPETEAGFESARTEAWINARKVGILLNTQHDGKLKTECWLDEARLKTIDKRVYDKILANEVVECSTGLGAVVDWTPGEHDGKKYDGIPRDYKPDHLAILPDKVGAFAGGGLLVNQLSRQPESTATVLLKSVEEALSPIGVEFLNNQLSFSDRSLALSDQLAARFGKPGRYWSGWLREVFDSFVIFRGEEDGKLWKLGYTLKNDVPVLDSGDPTEVVQSTVYKTTDGKLVNTAATPDPEPSEETDPMADRKTRIDGLITNSRATEADRPHLLGLSDTVFNAAFPETPPAKPEPTPTPVPVVALANAAPATMDEYLKSLPPEMARTVKRGMAADKARTELLVNTIKANPNNKFTEEALRNMDPDVLAGMAALVGPAKKEGQNDMFIDGFDPAADDYSGAAGPAQLLNNQANKVEIPKEGLEVVRPDFSKRFAGRN